jgi:hypothetical protein
MNLSKEQEQIVTTTANKVVVIASAASGKTAVLVERVRYLLKNGANPKGIVVITFTNAAAEELAERLDHPKGVFIGTIHSYANFLLLSNGNETHDLLESEQFDRLFRHAFETGELWLGKGDIGYRARVEGKNAGGKVWWYHYGITSFFVVFFCYNYIYVSLCKRRRMSYGQFIFLLAFWVSFYQRSDITEPHYLLPFVGAAILLSKNDVKSLKLEKREVK